MRRLTIKFLLQAKNAKIKRNQTTFAGGEKKFTSNNLQKV